jgi:hypothetical protein
MYGFAQPIIKSSEVIETERDKRYLLDIIEGVNQLEIGRCHFR